MRTVKRRLRARGLGLADVARMLNVDPSLVSHVVRRKARSERVMNKIRELIAGDERNPA